MIFGLQDWLLAHFSSLIPIYRTDYHLIGFNLVCRR